MSLVSTKIPFKGAGKEYIGDDVEEMVLAVKHAIQACCVQVRRSREFMLKGQRWNQGCRQGVHRRRRGDGVGGQARNAGMLRSTEGRREEGTR